jgi:hypothetical protein
MSEEAVGWWAQQHFWRRFGAPFAAKQLKQMDGIGG